MYYVDLVDTKVSTRNRIALPAIGAEVFTYLKDVNDRESFTASRRLKDLLSANLKKELGKYFTAESISKTSQSTLRKITNSLLSAGSSGNSRTLEALRGSGELEFSKDAAKDFSVATKLLREWSRDYRSAKGSLDNNFKCINSFLRVQKTPNDETVRKLLREKISNNIDFTNWNLELKTYWSQKELVKSSLQGAYLAIFDSFIKSFEHDLSNVNLSRILDEAWMRYLGDEQKQLKPLVEVSQEVTESMDNLKPDFFEIELEIYGSQVNYLIKCISLSDFQASQLRFKLALELSKSNMFPLLNFRVSLKKEDHPIIGIAVHGEQIESDLSNVVQFLESTLEKAKTTH